jgi:choline dehydrogenase-like flavoprotein
MATTQPPLSRYLTTPLADVADHANKQPYDAIVIGGGAAGLTAARRLVETGQTTLVLEGGPLTLLTHSSTTDLRFDQAGLARLRTMLQYSPRHASGKPFGQLIAGVGGRAIWWNGAAPRFAAEDFAGWPIQLDDLSDTYAWAERDLRVNRDYGNTGLEQTVIRLLRLNGLPAEPGPYAIDTHTTHDGWIAGTVGNPIAPLLRENLLTAEQPRLHLAEQSFAVAVLHDGSQATAVAVRDRSSESSYEIPARSVVLAAGGFESVRLSIRSGLPDASGRMGRYLSDHLFCRAYYPVSAALYDATNPEAAIVMVRAKKPKRFQLEIHMPSDNLFGLSEYTAWRPTDTQPYSAMVRSFAPVESRPTNLIEVGDSDEPGDYTVHLEYTNKERELLTQMQAGLESVRDALQAEDAEIRVFEPGDSHHEAGGLTMGVDPEASVTDAYGRFHQMPNVVVADAASWPGVSPANPCLTVTAIARRQADRLAESLASST